MEGERRTVTVLFADVVGSTAIAERIGEEEMYGLIQGCIARMVDAVHHYEGYVAHFTGDGIMAIFGAPIAHEASEHRALASALEMQRSLEDYAVANVNQRRPVECHFRVGLNTGPVVVGKVNDDLQMDFTAIGDTVNLAARMEQLADPGSVYLSEHTYQGARGFFEFEPLGALSVKGKAEPVPAYRALRERSVRTRFEVAIERGLAPCVGRERELALLEGYLERVRGGQGQVVFVSAESGMGKSRLLLEFRARLGEAPIWLEGQCISYLQSVAYFPMIEMLKRAVGVEDGDDDYRIIDRVNRTVATWDLASRATVPYLRYLLAVDPGDAAVVTMDARARQAGILDALRALVVQLSTPGPLVLVVEDLQWIDQVSDEAVAALVDLVPSTSVLLVLTARPGSSYAPAERSYVTRLALGTLTNADSTALVKTLLTTDHLPPEVGELIITRSEGNPFYLEEVTRSLLELGVLARTNGSYRLARPAEEIDLPDTIQGVILARIDRLERQTKAALQRASVIGRTFNARVLEAISEFKEQFDDVLGELQATELIYEHARFPELSYTFKHALTQEVAYSTLLVERRRALHRLVGAAIEELHADRLTEHYEALAHHFLEAQDWAKALDYLAKAGDKAAAVYANQEALAFYGQAIDVCDRLEDHTGAASVARKRAFVNFGIAAYSGAVTDFERLRRAARSLSDPGLEGVALAYRGMAEALLHNFEGAEATLRAALALADEADVIEVRVLASLVLGATLVRLNRHAEARPLLATVEDHTSLLPDPFSEALWGFVGGLGGHFTGRYDEALRHLDRSLNAAERATSSLLVTRWVRSLALGGKGEYEPALRLVEEIIEICDRVGDRRIRAQALNTGGWIYSELQDHTTALDWNTQGLQAAEGSGAPVPEIALNALVNLGDVLVALGRDEEGEDCYRRVEAVARHPTPAERWNLWRYSQHLFHSYGELWLARGELAKALAYAEECFALAEPSGSRKNIVKARRLRGQALAADGKLDLAEGELTAALALAQEVANPPQLWKTHAARGDLLMSQGLADDARQAYLAAFSVIDQVAGGLSEGLRETFLGSEHVQGIRRAAEEGR